MTTRLDDRQVVNRAALSIIGSSANATLDTVLPSINSQLGEFLEDRNAHLADGGTITFTGTTLTFTENLSLILTSRTAGGSPLVIDLGNTTRTLSADGKMVYAVINRSAGTATVTDDATSLPTASSSNLQVFLIAHRRVDPDGQNRVYFRDGTAYNSGDSFRIGSGSNEADGLTSVDTQSFDLTIDAGATLFHPYLTVDTGATYTIDGQYVGAEELTIDGTMVVNGTASILGGSPTTSGTDTETFRAVTSTDTLANSDDVVTLSGTFTFSLQALSGATVKPYKLINVGTGVITLDPNSTETLKGSATRKLMTTGESVTIFPDSTNTNWLVLEHHTHTSSTAWTPTIGGFGTVTGLTAFWYRYGERMRGRVLWSNGTVSASAATISLPGSYTLDAAKSTINNVAGNPGEAVGHWIHQGEAKAGRLVTDPATDTTLIYFGRDYGTTGGLVSQLGNAIMGSGDVVSVEFDIAITDWWE